MQGWYPVMYAVKEGHVELVKECFDKVEQDITTEVHCTCASTVNEYAIACVCAINAEEANSVAYSCQGWTIRLLEGNCAKS